jgi:hypothetical protein
VRIQADRDVLWREVDGEIVLLDPRTGAYFGLEGLGVDLWRRLQTSTSEKDLLAAVTADYDAPPEEIRRDAVNFLRSLTEEGLCHAVDL